MLSQVFVSQKSFSEAFRQNSLGPHGKRGAGKHRRCWERKRGAAPQKKGSARRTAPHNPRTAFTPWQKPQAHTSHPGGAPCTGHLFTDTPGTNPPQAQGMCLWGQRWTPGSRKKLHPKNQNPSSTGQFLNFYFFLN